MGVLDRWQSHSGLIDYHDAQLDAEVPIDEEFFCRHLKGSRPANCHYSSPPPVPGFTPNWQPNGCGSGPYVRLLGEQALGALYASNFTGNFDTPYRTRDGVLVSFLGACNAHDRCWGEGMDRVWCDETFRDRMYEACSVESSTSGYGICTGMASAYHAAVSTNLGAEIYNQAFANRECAAWVHDMKANDCNP